MDRNYVPPLHAARLTGLVFALSPIKYYTYVPLKTPPVFPVLRYLTAVLWSDSSVY